MVEQRKTADILFLGEQRGLAEQEFQAEVVGCFTAHSQVQSAYLVRVSFKESPQPQVALCIRGRASDATTIVECVGKIFQRQFKTTAYLDVLFLSDTQFAAIARVAKPFYSVAT